MGMAWAWAHGHGHGMGMDACSWAWAPKLRGLILLVIGDLNDEAAEALKS